MKKQIFFLLFLALPLFGIGQTWNLLGPDTANISRIDFLVALQYHVLSADGGFYLYHYGNNTFQYFSNGGLPVTGAAYFNNNKILITMGNGSYSDGIYTFDLFSHEFVVVEYLVWPSFLYYNEISPDGFWMGSEWGGLYKSEDGMAWDTIHYFDTINCKFMNSHENHVVVYGTSPSGIYFSNNNGNSWEKSPYNHFFWDFDYAHDGTLYAILPGYSNSSGLHRSDDYGWGWEPEYYYQQLNSVCVDVFSQILLGHDEDGIALYIPGQYELTFINGDLPCLNINNIQVNPSMSAPAIFVSTDEGVYYSYDYYVGMEEEDGFGSPVSISPNPAQSFIEVLSMQVVNMVQILDVNGKICQEIGTDGKTVRIDVSNLAPGLYFFMSYSEGMVIMKKFVVR